MDHDEPRPTRRHFIRFTGGVLFASAVIPLLNACAAAPPGPTSPPILDPAAVPNVAATSSALPAMPPARQAAAAPSGSVTVIQGPEITHLDSSIEVGIRISNPAAHIFDPLTWRNDDGDIQPYLATSWSYPDDRTIRLKIRKG